MPPFALYFLLLPFLAQANAGLKERKLLLDNAQEAARMAEAELPPCEGMDLLSEAVFKKDPPATCPTTGRVLKQFAKLDRQLRENCRDVSQWTENTIRQADLVCKSADQGILHSQLLKELAGKKKNFGQHPRLGEYDEAKVDRLLTKVNAKEAKNPECEMWLDLAMQFRKKQLGLAAKHFGIATAAIDFLCEEDDQSATDYLDFLRHGEDGN